VENDVSARPQSNCSLLWPWPLTSLSPSYVSEILYSQIWPILAFCDLELWPPTRKVHRFMSLPRGKLLHCQFASRWRTLRLWPVYTGWGIKTLLHSELLADGLERLKSMSSINDRLLYSTSSHKAAHQATLRSRGVLHIDYAALQHYKTQSNVNYHQSNKLSLICFRPELHWGYFKTATNDFQKKEK